MHSAGGCVIITVTTASRSGAAAEYRHIPCAVRQIIRTVILACLHDDGKQMVSGMSEEIREISVQEYKNSSDQYVAVDVRDAAAYQHGFLPGSLSVPADRLQEALQEEDPEAAVRNLLRMKTGDPRTALLYCTRGEISVPLAASLTAAGVRAVSLAGGFNAWILEALRAEENGEGTGRTCREIEASIRSRRFHNCLFSRFAKAINEYELLQPGDRVAVCISGGKDSMLMAKLFQELKRHRKFDFDLVFLVMDPGYSETNRRVIESNARRLEIPITIFETNIFDAVYDVPKSPCYLCARMRRGYLYAKAKELGCNKIALGHHYDDVIETILMGMLYGGQVQTMMPKLHSTNFEGMELIRPLYLVREEDIKAWRDANGLYFLQCACHFTETCTTCHTDGTTSSKRLEIKNLIRDMKKVNPYVESNIFRSVENVNLATVIAYKQDGVTHRFTDDYDKKSGIENQQTGGK